MIRTERVRPGQISAARPNSTAATPRTASAPQLPDTEGSMRGRCAWLIFSPRPEPLAPQYRGGHRSIAQWARRGPNLGAWHETVWAPSKETVGDLRHVLFACTCC